MLLRKIVLLVVLAAGAGVATGEPQAVDRKPPEGPDCSAHLRERDAHFREAAQAISLTEHVPGWVADARWYYIDVPSCRNGTVANDTPNTPALISNDPMAGWRSRPTYGGDLQGIRQALPYLKALGVNAVVLDRVFPRDVAIIRDDQVGLALVLPAIHVRDNVGVAGKSQQFAEETIDPKSWTWSDGDRLLLEITREARASGIRVLAMFPHPTPGRTGRGLFFYDYSGWVWHMNERWLRQPGSDEGLDGWADSHIFSGRQGVYSRWWHRLKQVNPDCVLVGLNQYVSEDDQLEPGRHVDTLIDTRPRKAVVDFLLPSSAIPPSVFASDFASMRSTLPECVLRTIRWPGSPVPPRLSYCLAEDEGPRPQAARECPDETRAGRVRLGLALHMLCYTDYGLRFGEEVALGYHGAPDVPLAMWWGDQGNPGQDDRDFRRSFSGVVRQINEFKRRFAALRRGSLIPLEADDDRSLLVLSREFRGEEVLIVVNRSGDPQRVSLDLNAGKRSVEVFPLVLDSTEAIAGVAINVDAAGLSDVDVHPMSITLVSCGVAAAGPE